MKILIVIISLEDFSFALLPIPPSLYYFYKLNIITYIQVGTTKLPVLNFFPWIENTFVNVY
jgi:hypothetical protein